jgi:ComF family protein
MVPSERNPLARALWAFKYDGRLDVGARLGRLLADQVPFGPRDVDLVLPVPLEPQRLRRRGFNQACVLADPVARRLRVPLLHDLLRRHGARAPQAGLPEAARWRNVEGVFTASGHDVAGARALLVDDVLTTGATVIECVRELRRAGAAAVDVLTLARAVRPQ